MMEEVAPVLVVGAGIAGLTLALALAAEGRRALLLERSERLEEVGAGLQLSPNASHVLLRLGLGADLDRMAVRPKAIVIRDARDAREIVRLPLGPSFEAAHGAPYLVVHRGDLQTALLSAVARSPLIDLRTAAAIDQVVSDDQGIDVTARTSAGTLHLKVPVLVGADGVRSQIRTAVLGGAPAVYSGRTAWRATLPAEAGAAIADGLNTTGLWLGRNAHLVHYPIRAGREFNLVAAVVDDWVDERWDAPGDRNELFARFAGWPEPVLRLLATAGGWRRWALCAAPASAPWSRGRIALVGDAVHGMLPFAAQGGAMAIEDAAVLAHHLVHGSGAIADRLAAYGRSRRGRVAEVVSTARRNGAIYHLSGPAASARNLAMQALGPDRLLGRMGWIYRWREPEGRA